MQISSVKFEDVGGNDATLKVSACWEKALYLHKQSLFVFNLNKKLYVVHHCMRGALRSYKGVPDSLELVLQTV